jgi:leader peptidase (prepilin peptidase)/N-methyltransferase
MINLCINLFVFTLGLTIGSFLNCVIYRLEIDKSFLVGRSFCPQCKHILSGQDLIPVLSFLFLKGKCRYCHKPISIQYPLVELATGLLFLLIFYNTSYNLFQAAYFLIISCFLIIIFIYDLKHYLIPDQVTYSAIALAFLYNLLNIQYLMSNTIYAALGASGFFLLIYLISSGQWLGFGDVKLAFLMGLFLGFPNILVALFLSFFIGAIVGLLLIAKGKKTLKSEVPFGPFLAIGTITAFLYGQQLIDWYSGLFIFVFP